MLKANDYDIEQDDLEIKNNTIHINYTISTKIDGDSANVGNLVSKIPKNKFEEFKEKYEENYNLKIME